jgi:hypothetical protein
VCIETGQWRIYLPVIVEGHLETQYWHFVKYGITSEVQLLIKERLKAEVRFVAFPVTKYDEKTESYQLELVFLGKSSEPHKMTFLRGYI